MSAPIVFKYELFITGRILESSKMFLIALEKRGMKPDAVLDVNWATTLCSIANFCLYIFTNLPTHAI